MLVLSNRGHFVIPKKLFDKLGKYAHIRSAKTIKKLLFDENETDILCLLQFRNALTMYKIIT